MSWIEDNKIVAVAFAIWIAFFLGIVCSRVYALPTDFFDYARVDVKYLGEGVLYTDDRPSYKYPQASNFYRAHPDIYVAIPKTEKMRQQMWSVIYGEGLEIGGTWDCYAIVWTDYRCNELVAIVTCDWYSGHDKDPNYVRVYFYEKVK